MSIHFKHISGGHLLFWSDLPKSKYQTLIIDGHGAESERYYTIDPKALFLPDQFNFVSLTKKANLTFTKRTDLELSFIAPRGYNNALYSAVVGEIGKTKPKPYEIGGGIEEYSKALDKYSKALDEYKKIAYKRLLTNSFELSETIPYGVQKNVKNYLLGSVMQNVRIIEVMNAMREEEETYQFSMTGNPLNPFSYDDMPSILLIAQYSDLESVLNIPELIIYKRVICTLCRGSFFSQKIYKATYRQHGK